MNKVYLIGNLTRDPELSETSSGIKLCRFSIAVNRSYASSDGTRETDFFNITVWRNQAEICERYLRKGSKVAIVGSLQNRNYEDKEGNKRTVTDIVASEIEFLSAKNSSDDDEEYSNSSSRKPSSRAQLEPVTDGDLPF